MIRINTLTPQPNYKLHIVFEDGRIVNYDVSQDFHLPGYSDLRDIPNLSQQVQLDPSRTCVYWNDWIDLPSDTLHEYGQEEGWLA